MGCCGGFGDPYQVDLGLWAKWGTSGADVGLRFLGVGIGFGDNAWWF